MASSGTGVPSSSWQANSERLKLAVTCLSPSMSKNRLLSVRVWRRSSTVWRRRWTSSSSTPRASLDSSTCSLVS